MTARRPDASRVLHFFPDYRDGNPFQTMLHAGLTDLDARAVPVTDLGAHLREAGRSSPPGTLHLHWTAPVLRSATGPFRAARLVQDLDQELAAYAARGGRLVWTVHNVLPHESRHRWADLRLSQLLADRADLVHVMSAATMEAVRDLYVLPAGRTVHIPHSSYLGSYPDRVDRAEARELLGLSPDDHVLVTLGGVRGYKGLDTLLDVFDALVRIHPTLRLAIAGRPLPGPEVERLVERVRATPGVVSRLEHVPTDKVQRWMRSADLAVLPYRQILNSGSFRLAETFGLPVVAPRTGTLAEAGGEPHVRLFTPGDAASLQSVLTEALRDLVGTGASAVAARESSAEAARRNPPEAMATAYASAVAPLLGA